MVAYYVLKLSSGMNQANSILINVSCDPGGPTCEKFEVSLREKKKLCFTSKTFIFIFTNRTKNLWNNLTLT